MPENGTSSNPTHTASPAIPNNPTNEDAELKAINAIVAALNPLKEEQRLRALEYVLRRFNAVALQAAPVAAAPSAFQPTTPAPPTAFTSGAPANMMDIRTLTETKQPKSANEMAALVAFYLSEVASPIERKQEIDITDIERYFKLAPFKLPAKAGQTLINAKNAGYLDAGSGAGQYKLNPVGYNLIVHRMGSGEAESRRRQKPAHKKNGKKPARAKK
ncbi:MAG: hypothetical protein ABSC77_06820 [Terracidiphilus sp.]|jgi:hypothetical protein